MTSPKRALPDRALTLLGVALLGTSLVWLVLQPGWSPLITLLGALSLFVEARRSAARQTPRRLSPRFLLQALSVLSLGGSLVWLVVQPSFEPLAAVVAGLMGFSASFAVSDAPLTSDLLRELLHSGDRRRRDLLQAVRRRWVQDALQSALFANVYLPLPARYRAAPSAAPEPGGDEALDVRSAFDRAQGRLLILGDPGAGKSLQLYVLIRDLLARAEAEAERPLPILYRLSSWAQQRLPLDEWLTAEVPALYGLSRGLFAAWLGASHFQLLLDGLDEVPAGLRDDCARAINAFMEKYPLVDVVVACRRQEHAALKIGLDLRGTYDLQALTPDLVQAYIAAGGAATEGLRALLASDDSLLEFVASPLQLDLVARTFEQSGVAGLPQLASAEQRRAYLFEQYLAQMFARQAGRAASAGYAQPQTLRWLGWLARRLQAHHQTLFPIESIQPSWIGGIGGRVLHVLGAGVVLVAGAMLSALFVSAAVTVPPLLIAVGVRDFADLRSVGLDLLVSVTTAVSVFQLFFGLVIGVVGALVYGPARRVTFSESLAFRLPQALAAGVRGVAVFLLSLLTTQLVLGRLPAWSAEGEDVRSLLLTVLFSAGMAAFGLSLVIVPAIGLAGLSLDLRARRLRWIGSRAYQGAGVAVSAGLYLMFAVALQTDPVALTHPGLAALTPLWPQFIVLGFSLGAVLGGLSSREMEFRVRPNEGFYRSLRNAVLLQGALFVLLDGVLLLVILPLLRASAVVLQLLELAQLDLALVLAIAQILVSGFALLMSWFAALRYGGAAVIHHAVLRVYLWVGGYAPMRYARFLDHACELVLLRRIGGVYEFYHPLLRDHIAETY